MKITHSDLKKGEVKVRIENPDDLWYLSNIIDPGDFLKGRTLRKIKIERGRDEKSSDAVKKPVFLKIRVEKVEYGADSSLLKVMGTIAEAVDDIPLGSYHSFNLEENSGIAIIKEKWLKFQLDKLKEASSGNAGNIIVCVFDREEALIALMKKYGYEILCSLKGDVEKKDRNIQAKGGFYQSIISQLNGYSGRYSSRHIILASPSFWKEELMKELKDDDLKKKIVLATCSSVGKNGIDEVMKRPEVKHALKMERASAEINLVEELLVEIAKMALAAYGMNEVENASIAGAVSHLLVTDSLIKKSREQNFYNQVDNIMRSVDDSKGDITIVSSEHEGGRKLDGLGGIGALLRYRMSY